MSPFQQDQIRERQEQITKEKKRKKKTGEFQPQPSNAISDRMKGICGIYGFATEHSTKHGNVVELKQIPEKSVMSKQSSKNNFMEQENLKQPSVQRPPSTKNSANAPSRRNKFIQNQILNGLKNTSEINDMVILKNNNSTLDQSMLDPNASHNGASQNRCRDKTLPLHIMESCSIDPGNHSINIQDQSQKNLIDNSFI